MIVIKPGRKPTELELKLAEAMGLKTEDGLYETINNPSLFTQPPYFSTEKGWINPLKDWAKERGIEIENCDDPKSVCEELLKKLIK